jgi:hypothetical protein
MKIYRPRLTEDEYQVILTHRGITEEFDNQQLEQSFNADLVSFLRDKRKTLEDVCNFLDASPDKARKELQKLSEAKYNVEVDDFIAISTSVAQGAKHSMLDETMWQGDKVSFGFTSDNHLCSHFERLDVLNLLYDLYASEGIHTVLNGGNWIDGEARFNKNEIHTKGMTKQIDYAVKNYPYREGIKTWFVSGDDHCGWYNQREGINIGEYFQMKREQAGLFDMTHLGYVEADIEINEGGFENESWMRVMHAGGGSAYATSYAPQKIIESLQGGEKPSVLFIGHYHKLSYNVIRNVHVIQMGCTQDQSIFMRKQKIEAHVGGGIIHLRRDKNGIINRVNVEFVTAFDKKFYVGDNKYWK